MENNTFSNTRGRLHQQYRLFTENHENSFSNLLDVMESEYASMYKNLEKQQDILRVKESEMKQKWFQKSQENKVMKPMCDLTK